MSTFDAEINVLSATVAAPSEEMLQAGAAPHIELGIIAGLGLPVPDPQTGKQLVIPVGNFRFTFDRERAIELFGAALRAAENLPENFAPSGKVMVARDMSDVANAAERIKNITGR